MVTKNGTECEDGRNKDNIYFYLNNYTNFITINLTKCYIDMQRMWCMVGWLGLVSLVAQAKA